MLSPLHVTNRQEADLWTLCDQSPDLIGRVADELAKPMEGAQTVPLLRKRIEGVLGPEPAISLIRQIIGLGTVIRRKQADPSEVIEALTLGLKAKPWSPDKIQLWEGIRGHMQRILSLEAARIVVKAIDLSFDYANLYQSARVITDIRPVLDESDRSNIAGAIVSQIMRLGFINEEGYHTISLLLDRHDIQELRQQCDEALNKAELFEKWLAASGVQTLYVGEDLDDLR